MPLSEVLDRLASFEPTSLPVISLYLNTQPDQHGRANFAAFVRKEFRARQRTYPLRSPERRSFDRDTEKIVRYLSVIIPTLRDALPPHLSDRVIDVLRLDIKTPEHEILRATLKAMRERDARDDAEKVGRLFDEYRAGGLAVVGVHDSLAALANGQVDDLFLSASLEEFYDDEEAVGRTLVPGAPEDIDGASPETRTVLLTDELVTRARQSGAQVNFIEDVSLLSAVGGVAATLRFRL